jgi:lipopolysaccharide export system permease protein
VLVLGIIVGLILLFDVIELLRRTVTIENIGFGTVLGMALLKLPHTIEDTLPFVVLIAAMFALFRLARSHELVVMRAAGVSVWQVLGPPLAAVGVLGVVNLLLFNPLAADLYDTYQRREDIMLHNATTATLDLGEGGLWLREVRGDAADIPHAADVHQQDDVLHLKKVSIFATDNQERFNRRYEAREASIADGKIEMTSVWEMGPGRVSAFHDTLSLPSRITPEKVQNSFASPESMSIWTLPRFIAFSRQSGFSVVPHRLYWHSLLVSPFLLAAMMLVASAFCLSAHTRFGAWTVRGLAALGTGFLFFFFNRFTYALGLSTTLPILLAAWAPTTIVALLGTAYLLHQEDG